MSLVSKMSEKNPRDTAILAPFPTIRGNIAVGIFVTFLLFSLIVFMVISFNNIVIFIVAVWPLLFFSGRFYYLMFKEIKKIQSGYYNIFSEEIGFEDLSSNPKL